LFQLGDHILYGVGPDRTLLGKLRNRLWPDIIDDAFMARLHEPQRHIGPHPAQTDDTELHLVLPLSQRAV